PFGGCRDGYPSDAGAPGGEGAAVALAVERTGPAEAAAEGAEPWMRPRQGCALLIAVTGRVVVGRAGEHRLFQFPVARGSVRTAGIERPLLVQTMRDTQVRLKSLTGLFASGV